MHVFGVLLTPVFMAGYCSGDPVTPTAQVVLAPTGSITTIDTISVTDTITFSPPALQTTDGKDLRDVKFRYDVSDPSKIRFEAQGSGGSGIALAPGTVEVIGTPIGVAFTNGVPVRSACAAACWHCVRDAKAQATLPRTASARPTCRPPA